MAKYIDADKLKVEIEKRLKNIRDYMSGTGIRYKGPKYFKAQGKESAYDALLSIIYSLQQEQPEEVCIFKPNMTIDEMIDSINGKQQEHPEQPTMGYDEAYLNEKIAKATKSWKGVDVDKFMDEMRGREPEVDLEEAAEMERAIAELTNEWIEGEEYGELTNSNTFRIVSLKEVKDAMRHVYELGRGSRNIQITPILEDAAFDYAESCHYEGVEKLLCVEHFRAGAKWQAEQDDRDVVFWKGMQHAYDKLKEDAVEGEVILSHGQKVIEHKGSVGIQESSFPNMNGFSIGDKVFIIITK